jgi:hypothetical protein
MIGAILPATTPPFISAPAQKCGALIRSKPVFVFDGVEPFIECSRRTFDNH